MKLIFFLIFLQIRNVFNTLTINNINNAKFSKPFIYNNNLYILCNGKILDNSNNDEDFIIDSKISHSSEIGTPLIKDDYIITINVDSDNQNFKFVKIKMETESTSSLLSTYSNSISSSYIKLTDNNICLFQMKFELTHYYYASWIDNDFIINLVQFNSEITGISQITKSNVIIKGRTIDCKAFASYGDIICIYVGYDGCNLNVYRKDITSIYTETLIQKKNLVELGFDCNIKSQGQKIYNINGNKFLICYSKYEDNSFYCIIGEHNSINSIKIKSKTSIKLLDNCEGKYFNFDIGKIGVNYMLIC